METIAYKNHDALKRAFCSDCDRRREHGCEDMDPMDCDIVKAHFIRLTDNGYKVQVGMLYVKPNIKEGGEE